MVVLKDLVLFVAGGAADVDLVFVPLEQAVGSLVVKGCSASSCMVIFKLGEV